MKRSKPKPPPYIPNQPTRNLKMGQSVYDYEGFGWRDEDGNELDFPAEIDMLAAHAAAEKARWYILALPFPPSANRYWRKGQNGNTYRSNEAEDYIALITGICLAARLSEPLTGQLKTYGWFWRDMATRDLNNCTKILYDALQKLAYVDDNQICNEHHVRDYNRDKPCVLMFIGETIAADDWKVKEIELAGVKRLKRLLNKPAY